MEEQKKVIISLIKQAGSNIIHGRSFMNVSLPLEVFEPRSFLERLARSFGHAPDFLGFAYFSFFLISNIVFYFFIWSENNNIKNYKIKIIFYKRRVRRKKKCYKYSKL